jgi:hypothetical protein
VSPWLVLATILFCCFEEDIADETSTAMSGGAT